ILSGGAVYADAVVIIARNRRQLLWMPTYIGNPSLSNAVKERVLSTFQQTLGLYKQGRTGEVLAGCTLMLQMDPMFEPAKQLAEKTRNPGAAIDVDSLIPSNDDAALREARTAMANRDFSRVLQITTEILTNDLMNDAARILADEARDKMEAAPFVEQFAAKCEKSLQGGDVAGAKTALEKARALDPEHPSVLKMEQMINARSGGAPAPAAPASFDFGTSFVVDTPQQPSIPGRGTAQATDFGFTFEEEKPAAAPPADAGFGGFSFDPPAAPAAPAPAAPAAPAPEPGGFSFGSPTPASDSGFSGFSFDNPTPAPTPAAGGFSFDSPAPVKAPVSGDFDFATASIETSAEDQQKIQQYLTDGDRAFEASDYQKAIDLWSRIFLIDVTNEQASERIERAKKKKKEIEAQSESVLASAIAAFDRGDHETARAKFSEVLRSDPGNATAQDYMDRLTDSVTEGGAAGIELPYNPPSSQKFDIFAEEPISEGTIGIGAPSADEDEIDTQAPAPAAKGAAKKAPA